MKRRLIVVVAAAAVVLLGRGLGSPVEIPRPWGTPASSAESDGLTVVDQRPAVPGYDRSCKAMRGCVFGPAWSDDVDVQDGHNGCDQRSDVLRRQLEEVQLKPGTNGCVVASGILRDPYTGKRVVYQRTGNTEVVADHVVPLAAAWDLGAAQWAAQKRQNFANDPRNLIVTTNSTNSAKGDKTPGEWMPQQNQCRYARTYLEVTTAYGVALTRADQRALAVATSSC